MENTIKFLSLDKSCRFSVLNCTELGQKYALDVFKNESIKKFSKELMMNCILLSAINSHSDKISFSFRFSEQNSIFCEINQNTFDYSLSQNLKETTNEINQLIQANSTLSVTKGDWNTGLHTGTVLVTSLNPKKIMSHYATQSEQLQVFFMTHHQMEDWHLIIQPLPFISKKQQENILTQLSDIMNDNRYQTWDDLLISLNTIGTFIEKNQLNFS